MVCLLVTYIFGFPSRNFLSFSLVIDVGAAIGGPWEATLFLAWHFLQRTSLPVCQTMNDKYTKRERGDNIVRGKGVYAFPISSGEISPSESEGSSHPSPSQVTGFHPYQSVPLLSLVCEIVFPSSRLSHVMFPHSPTNLRPLFKINCYCTSVALSL